MLPYLIIFTAALVALIVLFVLKLVERRGRTVTALSSMRSVGDPLIEEGFMHYAKLCRTHSRSALESAVCTAKEAHKRALVYTLAHTQRATSKLHEFLMRRRVQVEGSSEKVSTHLKSVLEKEEPPTDNI